VGAVGQMLDLGAVRLPLDGEALFGSPVPLEVELGSGNGQFLLHWAVAHPAVGLIGVERARKYLEMAAARAERAGILNVWFVHTTAEDLLFRCLAPGSVTAVHVYFPDPWPKNRHHKRRFFRSENVARVAEVLAPNGLLRVKTDHADYASLIGELLAAESALQPTAADAEFEGLPATNFEVKYARDARPVHRFAFRRL
jgi:tRNA (guanine-N7-)-methyltransferase